MQPGHAAAEPAQLIHGLGIFIFVFTKSLIEDERPSSHLVWKPHSFSGPVDEMLDAAAETQASQKTPGDVSLQHCRKPHLSHKAVENLDYHIRL